MDSPDVTPRFSRGDLVALRADPSRAGSIVGEASPLGGQPRFRVWHGPDEVRTYLEDQLILAPHVPDADSAVVAALLNDPLPPAEFWARLTAARLQHPQLDNLYALHAARIRFIPFQFKPVLRLLRSDRPRLLIADDVGVGKTIEAGLIMKELAARQSLERVLVVCPKALTAKWRAEMLRFDERFTVLDGPRLRWCIEDAPALWRRERHRSHSSLRLIN